MQCGKQRAIVAKLQQALEVLGDISGAEVDGLRSALEKAKKLSSEKMEEVQITGCKGFIARSEKRVSDLDAQRAQEGCWSGRRTSQVRVVLPSPEDSCVRGDEVEGSREPIASADWTVKVDFGQSNFLLSIFGHRVLPANFNPFLAQIRG